MASNKEKYLEKQTLLADSEEEEGFFNYFLFMLLCLLSFYFYLADFLDKLLSGKEQLGLYGASPLYVVAPVSFDNVSCYSHHFSKVAYYKP